MKSILLVDDHEMIRDAIKFYFVGDTEYEITGEACNGQEALDLLVKNGYDLVISDINMPTMDGLKMMENIQVEFPNQKVLILSMQGDAGAIKKMISLGASGFILKNSSKEKLKLALSEILHGNNFFSEEVYSTIIDQMAGRKPKQRLSIETKLSEREKDVLKLIIEELSNQEMADKLFISIRTVETHKRNLLEKTGCKNVAGLVMYAVERDLV